MLKYIGERLLAAIPDRGYTVVLDERGQVLDSLKFAKWIEKLTIDQPHGVNFVVGGDLGFDDRDDVCGNTADGYCACPHWQ